MNKLPLSYQCAIANWKEFHKAGLNKKQRTVRQGYNVAADKCELFVGPKQGLLSTEHYILLNLLRKLPPERGYNPEGEAYKKAVANLVWAVKQNHYWFYAFPFKDAGLIRRLIIDTFGEQK